MEEKEVHRMLFPEEALLPSFATPDFSYIHKELLKSGIYYKGSRMAAMKNDTLKKLKAMRLPTFAEAYQMQNDRKPEYQSMSFHERLMLLVDAEYDSRHNNNIKRLVKNARLSELSAFLGSIDYLPDRHLDKDLLKPWRTTIIYEKG